VNTQAEELNRILNETNPVLTKVLSDKALSMYFPYAGILGQSAGAKGKKYNATIGIAVEDDKTPMRLGAIDELISLEAKESFPYAPSFGNPELRKTWKDMLATKNPSLKGKSCSNPVVTQALTHGLFLGGALFLNPGEEILIPDPYWDNYGLLFDESLGAKVKAFDCFNEKGGFNIVELKKVLSEREGKKVVLLLNFPNNPTGYTPLESEMKDIVAALTASAEKGTQIVTLIDDAYFGLVYEEGVAKESIFADLADAHENILAVKIDGATKEDYVWGLRVGFMTFACKGVDDAGYKALADKTGGFIRGMISNCSQLSQSLMLKAYTSDDYESQKAQKFELMKSRYDVLKKALSEHPEYSEEFTALPYNSGYFMCIQPKGDLDTEKVRLHLLDAYDTGIIALGNLIRVAFSSAPAETIPTILDNVYKACKEIRQGA